MNYLIEFGSLISMILGYSRGNLYKKFLPEHTARAAFSWPRFCLPEQFYSAGDTSAGFQVFSRMSNKRQ